MTWLKDIHIVQFQKFPGLPVCVHVLLISIIILYCDVTCLSCSIDSRTIAAHFQPSVSSSKLAVEFNVSYRQIFPAMPFGREYRIVGIFYCAT